MLSRTLLALLVFLLKRVHGVYLDLGGPNWRLKSLNGTVNVPTEVPGYALKALSSAKVIGDYHHRFGERDARWVALEDWVFVREFIVPHCFLEMEEVDLYLENIDTFAKVVLNGQEVNIVNNFHRWYRVPVKKYLNSGNNLLVITIESSVKAAEGLKQAYPYPLPSTPEGKVLGADLFNMARKTGSDFGWDWAPAFAPSGIAGRVRLEAYDLPFLIGALVRQQFVDDVIMLDVLVELQVPAPKMKADSGLSGRVHVEIKSLGLMEEKVVRFHNSGRQSVVVKMLVKEDWVKLWWPAGLGEQPLYNMTISFHPDATSGNVEEKCEAVETTGSTNIALTRRVGFRDVRLVEVPLEEARKRLNIPALEEQPTDPGGLGLKEQCGGFHGVDLQTKLCRPGLRCVRYTHWWWDCKKIGGESFYFEVNGVPVYAKGTNLVPMNVLPTEVTSSYMETLLQYALEANMNMIRIWGGGMYQRDELYQWCDKHGLMVWQETMFACAPYPRSEEFLDNVREEVHQQVMRLGSHPSVVAWAGNNEVEASLGWYEATRDNPLLYAVDYQKLFVDTIGGVLADLDPYRPYVDGSPSNGMMDKTLKVKRWGDPQDPMYGDVHYYNQKPDCRNPDYYPPSKFVSEHGVQSYPSLSSLAPVTLAEDWRFNSSMMQFRQRGTNQLMLQMSMRFRVPSKWEAPQEPQKSEAMYRHWLYLTQVVQMMCYETAFGTWRRWRSDPLAMTMGALYWQLNDIWPAASCSSLNSDLRWKPVHYLVRRVFASLAVVGFLDRASSSVKLYVINDYPTKEQVIISVHLRSIRDTAATPSCPPPITTMNKEVPPLSASEVYSAPVQDLLAGVPGGASHMYVHVEMTQRGHGSTRGSRYKGIPTPVRDEQEAAQHNMGSDGVASEVLRTKGGRKTSNGAPQSVLMEGEHGPHSLEQPMDLSGPRAVGFLRQATQPRVDQVQIWVSEFKDMDALQDPHITVDKPVQLSPTEVQFSVHAQLVAIFVVMETKYPGYFDTNAFVLHPCQPQQVTFYGQEAMNSGELVASLVITSLFDTQM